MQVVSVDELSEVVEHRLGCSPNFKYFYDPKTKAYQGRPHQYNCTYYSALGGNERHYLLARAIQFFTPGIPMVYYVGLFAGLNDYDVSGAAALGRKFDHCCVMHGCSCYARQFCPVRLYRTESPCNCTNSHASHHRDQCLNSTVTASNLTCC